MKTSRPVRMAQYTAGLALGILLIAVTVARADISACQQCTTYWSVAVTQDPGSGNPKYPWGYCHSTPTKGCVDPIVKEMCKNYCPDKTLPDGNVTCDGQNSDLGITCKNETNGPCKFEVWGRSCGSGFSCYESAVTGQYGEWSTCWVQCTCGTPP